MLERLSCGDRKRRRWLEALSVALLFDLAVFAAPALEIQPKRIDFGKMRQGAKKRKIYRLTNKGDAELKIGQIRASCAECLVDKVKTDKLAPGKEIELPVTYHATAVPGRHTAHVTIHSNDPEQPFQRLYLEVEIVGERAAPRVEVTPAKWDFGVARSSETVRRTVTVKNSGDAPLEIEDHVAGPGLRLEQTLPATVAPGKRLELSVTLRPRQSGILRAHLILTTNDPKRSVVTVAGEGYAASEDDLARLLSGVLVRPGRDAVEIENHDANPVRVKLGDGDPTTVAPGKSATIEASGKARPALRVELTLAASGE